MSLPFFDTLQVCFPQSQIDIIAKDTVQEVFRHHPGVRRIHRFSKARVKGVRGLFAYGRELRQHETYDLFLTLPTSFSSAIIGCGVGSRIRAGYRAEGRRLLLTHSFPQPRGIHRAQIYRHLLHALEARLLGTSHATPAEPRKNRQHTTIPWPVRMPPDESITRITFPFSDQEQRTSFLTKQPGYTYVVFNVNADAQSRRLPLEKWITLGNRLLQDTTRKIMLVFIGTTNQRSRVAEVIQGIEPRERILDCSGKTSLRELAMLLRDADAVVTNDSGPMHLANAVGAPVVTFFGAGDPVETKPFNKDNTIIIQKSLPCSPCVKNICPFPTVRCLEQITADEIYQNVVKLLSR